MWIIICLKSVRLIYSNRRFKWYKIKYYQKINRIILLVVYCSDGCILIADLCTPFIWHKHTHTQFLLFVVHIWRKIIKTVVTFKKKLLHGDKYKITSRALKKKGLAQSQSRGLCFDILFTNVS